MIRYILIFILLVGSGYVEAATYFVDKDHGSASDSNPGTESQPWLTIQKGVDTAQAADIVYVKSGTYSEDVSMARSGTQGSPITFENYNNDTVIVDGGTRGEWAVVDWAAERDYIIWDGIDIKDGSNIGMRVWGSYNIIQNSYVYDNGPGTQSGILLKTGDYNIVRNCDVQNNHNGIMIADCNYTEIENNLVRDNVSHSGVDFLPDTDRNPQLFWTGNNVRHNILYNNNHNIYSRYQQNNEYSNNLIYESVSMGIYFAPHPSLPPGTYSGYTKVYNNTISDSGVNGILNESTNYLTIKNNIISYSGQYGMKMSKVTGHDIDYNLYYPSVANQWSGTNYTSLSSWQSASNSDGNSLIGDPSFENRSGDDYDITANSQAIDNGENLAYSDTSDINDVSRPQGSYFDIGAYEYGDAPVTDPPYITVTKPSGTIQVVPDDVSMSSAASSGNAGYTYRIKAGTYTVDFSSSGSSGNEIVYEAYGDGRVTIRANAGGDVRITGSNIIFDGLSGQDIEFKRTSGATHIVRPEGDDITFSRIRITGPTGDCGLTDNTCVNLLDAGNSGHPARTYIYNSIIKDCNHKGIYVKDANDSEIRNNVFEDNESHDIQLNPHDPGEGIDGLIISGNKFIDGGTCGTYPGRNIYVLGTSDSDELRDVEVFNNIFYNKANMGVSFNGYSGYPQGYFRVYNNTFYGIGNYDLHVDDVMTEANIYLANNITSTGNSIPGGIGLDSDNDAGPGFASTDINSPNFLKLTATHTASYDTNPPVTDDYFGNPRPSSLLDQGAHQYGESGPDVTAPQVATKIIQTDGVSLFITFDETVIVANSTGFTISGAAGGVQISSCNTASTPMDCTLDGTILDDDTGITLSYTGPYENAIEDGSGNDLADFADSAVTNNSTQVEPDTTAPEVSSIEIPVAGTTLIVSLNESVTESGTGSDWAFTMSAGAATLSSPSVVGNIITYTLSRTIQNGETLSDLDYTQPGDGIEDVAGDNDLASISNYSGTFANNSTEGLPQWGDNSSAGTEATGTVSWVFYMGGTSPDIENMILEEVHCYQGDTGTTRIGVYQGGALGDPTGATRIWDAGTQSVGAAAGWVSITGGSAAFAANTTTWIGVKAEDYVNYFSRSWDSSSDFQEFRGRYAGGTESTSTADAFDATFATGGSFADYWYTCYVVYSQSSDTTPPTLEDVTISESGNTVIMDFDEPVTESGTGSDWSLTLQVGAARTLSNPIVDVDKITYTLSDTVPCRHTLSELDYTQPGNGIEDLFGNDLVTINNFAGTFINSAICIPKITSLTVGKLE